MSSRIRGRATTMALAVAAAAATLAVVSPGTASAGVWFRSQDFATESACVAEKDVFHNEYGFLVSPNGNYCFTSTAGHYYKHMEEF
jgi:hypothetical protein